MPRIQAATVAEHRARQRRAILDAARAIIAEGSVSAPSLADVARRMGLARPSVYQYFKSRDDLLEAVVTDLYPAWAAHVAERMAEATTPGERVLAYVSANLDLVAKGEHAMMRGLASTATSASVAESSRVLHERLRTPLVTALDECGAADPAGMADLIQAVVYAAARMIENGTPGSQAHALTRSLLKPYLRDDGVTGR